MTPEQGYQLRPLYEHLLGLSPEEQRKFLEGLRLADQAVAARLESLLATREQETVVNEMSAPRMEFRPRPGFFVPGDVVEKRFRIVRRIGRGGMGEVFEAEDLQLGRVALKTIRTELVSRPGMLEAFRREVQLARRISNPHVCRIHELFVSEAHGPEAPSVFLTMEYIEGESLTERLARGPLDWREAEKVVLQLCEGLTAIHRAGIVHRDFKSRNVMMALREGSVQAVITDFGLALENASAQVEQQSAAGTPEYMAPEQFERKATSAATDIYALGVVLYEMLTGLRPFAADSLVGTAVRRARRPTPVFQVQKHVPHRFNDIIDCCLRYEAAERYQSAALVAAALRARPWNWEGWRREWRRGLAHPRAAMSVLTLFLLLLAGAAWWRNEHRYHEPTPQAQRWFQAGLAAVREGTYIKAANALQEALKADGHFALAHAWLAETWNELDYYGQAKDEILRASAPDVARNLPEEQRLYLAAIRATVLHEFEQAVQSYSAVLTLLPQNGQADAYVDLGRAYERAGDLKHATGSYRHATELAPEGAAAYMRIGVLEARQSHWAAAHTAFDKAERIYRASSNYEGLAEVEYQRGYEASFDLHPEQARRHLDSAIAAAKQLDDLPLQARALCRRSATEYNDNNDAAAIAFAQQAIELAESNGLSYWATDGRIRMANSYLYEPGKLDTAAKFDEQAMHEAERNQWPLLLANARMTMASIHNQQGRPGAAIPVAQSALEYYESAGYYTESAGALTLLIRSHRDQGRFDEARKLFSRVALVERGSGDPTAEIQVEEAVGSVYDVTEDWPAALVRFERAIHIAGTTGSSLLGYELMHRADNRKDLGDYTGAESDLEAVAGFSKHDAFLGDSVVKCECELEESRRRFREALATGLRSSAFYKKPPVPVALCLAVARFQLGPKAEGLQLAQAALAEAVKGEDKTQVNQARLATAQLLAQNNEQGEALPLAEQASRYFQDKGIRHSGWMSLALLGDIAERQGDLPAAARYRAKALDIVHDLQHNWETLAFESYRRRPDVKEKLDPLLGLRADGRK